MAEGDIILITPTGGRQALNEQSVNDTIAAMEAGTTLSAEQQGIANVFGGSSSAVSNPAVLPTTTTGTSGATVTNRITNFLQGLNPSQTGTPAGISLGNVGNAPAQGPALDLRGLLLPNLGAIGNPGQNASGAASGTSLGDPELAERVANLRLRVEQNDLRERRREQDLQDLVRLGLGSQASQLAQRQGISLSSIGYTPPAPAKNTPRFSLLSQLRTTPIASQRPRSIIGV